MTWLWKWLKVKHSFTLLFLKVAVSSNKVGFAACAVYLVHVYSRGHKFCLPFIFSLLSLGLCEFYRLFCLITINHGIFPPPLNCYTIALVLGKWCLCTGWTMFIEIMTVKSHWTNQSCVCVSFCSWTQRPVISLTISRSNWTTSWTSWAAHLETRQCLYIIHIWVDHIKMHRL